MTEVASSPQPDPARARGCEPASFTVRKRARIIVETLLGGTIDSIVLFGSRARGDATDDSDWDVLVMVNDAADMAHARMMLIEATGTLAEETGEQVNFKCLRWLDAAQNASLLVNVERDGVPL